MDQIAHYKQAQGRQAAGGARSHPLDPSQGGVQLNTGGGWGWAPAGRLQPQPRSRHGGWRFKTLAQLLQRLAALAHQALAALQGQLVVVAEIQA